MTKKTTKKGFTLIELLVVVAIIGTISGIVMQNIQNARKKAMNVTRNQNIDQLANAINLYLTNNNNVYPTHTGTLDNAWYCVGAGAAVDCWGSWDGSPTLDGKLRTVITDLPKDPVPGTFAISNYYVYTSSWTDGTATYPKGSYLFWNILNLGQSAPCGRGVAYSVGPLGGAVQCIRYLGPGNL